MADMEARLVTLRDEHNLPIVPRVSSKGVVMSDGTALETYIDKHAGSVEKLNHSLTIGDKVFDGSEDVIVEVYDGDMDNALIQEQTNFKMAAPVSVMTNTNDTMQLISKEENKSMTIVNSNLQMKISSELKMV